MTLSKFFTANIFTVLVDFSDKELPRIQKKMMDKAKKQAGEERKKQLLEKNRALAIDRAYEIYHESCDYKHNDGYFAGSAYVQEMTKKRPNKSRIDALCKHYNECKERREQILQLLEALVGYKNESCPDNCDSHFCQKKRYLYVSHLIPYIVDGKVDSSITPEQLGQMEGYIDGFREGEFEEQDEIDRIEQEKEDLRMAREYPECTVEFSNVPCGCCGGTADRFWARQARMGNYSD